MIKQCKGKALDKISKSKLISDNTKVIASKKYDGNYIQIHKEKDTIRFFTSGGKEFRWEDLAFKLLEIADDFKIEAEYIGITKGKLGSRTESSTGHFRSQFEKNNPVLLGLGQIRVFDLLDTNLDASARLLRIKKLFKDIPIWLEVAEHKLMTFDEAKEWSKKLANEEWEGVVVKTLDHKQLPGKRVNNCIKLKSRKTVDLLCVGVNNGTGKYANMIGSLTLTDKAGRRVDVGSGLDDIARAKLPSVFINQVIEIEYEQILDTYIQPTFIRIRLDKTSREID